MAKFCSNCGTSLGFLTFKKKVLKKGQQILLCKRCFQLFESKKGYQSRSETSKSDTTQPQSNPVEKELIDESNETVQKLEAFLENINSNQSWAKLLKALIKDVLLYDAQEQSLREVVDLMLKKLNKFPDDEKAYARWQLAEYCLFILVDPILAEEIVLPVLTSSVPDSIKAKAYKIVIQNYLAKEQWEEVKKHLNKVNQLILTGEDKQHFKSMLKAINSMEV